MTDVDRIEQALRQAFLEQSQHSNGLVFVRDNGELGITLDGDFDLTKIATALLPLIANRRTCDGETVAQPPTAQA